MHRSHHGFRKSHNTCTAMLQMYNYWIDNLENDEISAAVLIDMSAAFDVLDHKILIEKMEIYGFQSDSIQWINSYLKDRSQQVLIDGQLSSKLSLEAGVPQGSILGPLLYIIFTNDLPEVIHEHIADNDEYDDSISNIKCKLCGEICCYADDTTYSKSSKDPIQLKTDIDSKAILESL